MGRKHINQAIAEVEAGKIVRQRKTKYKTRLRFPRFS